MCESAIWSLNHKISAEHVEISVAAQVGNNMEWSFNVEAEFGVELSLLWFRFHLIDVDDSPFLVHTIMPVPDDNISVLMILSTMYIKNLSSFILEVLAPEFEELEPSSISSPDLEIL